MAQVVIAGGGVVGQATALLLARYGHDVLVLEHDGPPPSRSPDDDVDAWHRPGVPQAIHAHVFRARAARVLRDHLPDVLAALDARGVERADIDFGPGFEDDVALSARRPVVEAALHRAAAAEDRVTHRYGVHVDGLVVRDRDGRASVEGVVVGDGEQVHADLVVDGCGRRSRMVRWLRDAGAAVADERFPCDLHYVARHYRVRDGAAVPSRRVPVGVRTSYGLFVAFGGDNGTFALAGAVSKEDPHRAALRRGDTFDRVLAAIPDLAPWVEAGTPITPVRLMAGLANRRRSLAPDGAPPDVEGIALVGDASLYTNATLGQGIALGLWQAQHLVRLLEDVPAPRRVAAPLEQWTDTTLGPWFAAQVAVDAGMVDVLRAGARGQPTPDTGRPAQPMDALMALTAAGDPVAAAARARVRNLLTSPEEVMGDPALSARVEAWLADHPVVPTPPDPLPRARFEALVS